MAGELIECNDCEDLFPALRSLYDAQANILEPSSFFFFVVSRGNKFTYMIPLSITDVLTIKGGICKAQSEIKFDVGKKMLK